jgi:hypothetical protein
MKLLHSLAGRSWIIRTSTVLLIVGLSCVPVPAAAFDGRQFIRSLDRMMVSMSAESARDARAIKAAYREHLELLVLNQYDELEGALLTGGLAPLPDDPLSFNLAPRLSGPSPIGEKDIANQTSYIAARPATIGALLEVASRVKSGPLEITSLVRHTDYQSSLRSTNANATTSVPMHTMGLAFDIALINTPLKTVYEIRDVLRKMRNAGEILFIGERQQLVFHVVPHPSRLGQFTQRYAQAFGAPPAASGTPVVAFSPAPGPAGRRRAAVSAEVIAVLPTKEFVDEWWATDDTHGNLAVEVEAVQQMVRATDPLPAPAPERAPIAPLLAVLAGTFAAIWLILTMRRPSGPGLFQHS